MQEHAPWLVAQRYEVGEVVGRGGYGMVCRGLDRETGRPVALKMLSAESGKDPDVVERMLREQQALVALAGTSAVTAFELCRLESGAPCLVMEWLEGQDLEHVLSEREAGNFLGDTEELVMLLEPVAVTLTRAHEIGLVHRDVKPANIFLTPSAATPARLLDFGLSRMKSAAPITAAGMVMGSPSYIAPETWAGDSRALDGRADLFSLGVIVFRWLTGKLPFDTPDLIGKMTAVTTGPRPTVSAVRSDLPKAVDSWMSRALAINPAERFQTGSELHEALKAALRGEEYPVASAEASGIRPVGGAVDSIAPTSALASAWKTATSLLKRITSREPSETNQPSPSAPPALPLVATAAPGDDAPVSERQSVWLDSDELEDVLSERVPAPRTAPPPAPSETRSKPHKASKAKKSEKLPKKRVKGPKTPKAKAKKPRKRAKKS